MFKILVDGVVICNSYIPESMVINPIIVLEANKTGSFSFTFPANHPYIGSIDRLTSIIEVYRDDELLFRGICSNQSEDLIRQQVIECEGELTYLNDSILRQHKFTNQTVFSLLSAYIDEHNKQVDYFKQFKMGQVTVNGGSNIYRFTNMQSPMKEIQEDLIDNFGGYIYVRRDGDFNYIDYIAEPLNVCNQSIELGVNLIDYNSNIDDTDLATVIIPLGTQLEESEIEGLESRLDIKSVNGGRDYIEADAEIIERFGRRVKVVVWDDVTDANNLLRKGQEWLTNNQFEKVYIKVNGVDLGQLSSRKDTFHLLDRIHIKSPLHGMDRDFILTKMTINLANPASDVFEFGIEVKQKLTAKNNKIETVAKMVEQLPSTNEVLKLAQEKATALIAGAEGGHVVIDTKDGQPNRILIMDTDNIETAKNIIQLNKNGIGFSTDGGETYKNAWTIDGNLVADFITTGILTGITIQNGNGTFSVNENGFVVANSGYIGSFNISAEQGGEGDLVAGDGTHKLVIHKAGYDGTRPHDVFFIIDESKSDRYVFTVKTDGEVNTQDRVIAVKGVTAGTFHRNDSYKLWVEGTGYATNSFVSGSDRNLKNSIENIDADKSVDFINKLRPVRYKYNDGTSDRYHHGFIAQEVKEAMGEDDWGVYVDMDATAQDGDYAGKGTKGLRYEEIIADLVGTVNYLCDKIKEMEERRA